MNKISYLFHYFTNISPFSNSLLSPDYPYTTINHNLTFAVLKLTFKKIVIWQSIKKEQGVSPPAPVTVMSLLTIVGLWQRQWNLWYYDIRINGVTTNAAKIKTRKGHRCSRS